MYFVLVSNIQKIVSKGSLCSNTKPHLNLHPHYITFYVLFYFWDTLYCSHAWRPPVRHYLHKYSKCPDIQTACSPWLLGHWFLILNGSSLVFTGEGIKKCYKLGGIAPKKRQKMKRYAWLGLLVDVTRNKGWEVENYMGRRNTTVVKDLTNN